MHVEITSQGFELTESLRDYALRRLRTPLMRARDRARQVSIHLSDENGPRGGVDKRCLVAIRLAGSMPLVIEETQTDLYSAIDSVSKRASHALNRRLQRRHAGRNRTEKRRIIEAFANADEALPSGHG